MVDEMKKRKKKNLSIKVRIKRKKKAYKMCKKRIGSENVKRKNI